MTLPVLHEQFASMTWLEMMHIAKQRAWGTSLLTLCPQIKVPLITVCLDVLKYTTC